MGCGPVSLWFGMDCCVVVCKLVLECGLVVLVWFEMFRHFPGWLILGLVGWGCVVSVVFGLGCV